ncbi:hypothetical protein QWM81_15965 [Streptomyces ficellus]|uniref:Uncharacterized protein n=1 Tax=Streptomyces ficellus TaxID=1977088 RepID=A0ABT7Z7P9_9ACTN|nr:hypothetical protein [Streptomyces ficellus]MDN3295520.1 hypothetical protein [Streptomyces ficellus]
MGWTVLYIAFGVVALWLLGEVLLQYKARLRWRLLAFAGFLGVVIGVLLPSVPVIGAGAIAFAIGQTYVTLSFRRGFSTGWAIGGRPGASRRRKAGPTAAAAGPTLEVSDVSYEQERDHEQEGPDREPAPAGTSAVYEPQPLPDETGQYGIYGAGPGHAADHTQQTAAYDGGFGTYAATGYDQQDAYATAAYDYGTGDQQYAAYSDPYIGTAPASGGTSYGSYDSYGGQQQYADPYAPQYGMDTPPGGVWVPQQRDGEQQFPPPPQDQPSPYGYEPGQDGQPYRY